MSFRINPFRLYRNVLCMDHGLLVEILRASIRFWHAYRKLLEANGKGHVAPPEAAEVLEQLDMKPDVRPATPNEAVKQVIVDIEAGLEGLDDADRLIKEIMLDDETLLFREFLEARALYNQVRRFEKNDKVSDNLALPLEEGLYHLMHEIIHVQEHEHSVAKAHTRNFAKVADIIRISASSAETRRIRIQAIEVDHLQNRIRVLGGYITNVKNANEPHKFADKSHELIAKYRQELRDLRQIMYELSVLIYRTHHLFDEIRREARALANPELDHHVERCAERFHQLHIVLQTQARREFNEMKGIFNSLPKPKVSKKKSKGSADVIDLKAAKKALAKKEEEQEKAKKKAEKVAAKVKSVPKAA